MAGLAEMFGWSPVSQFIDPRRNALMMAGAGLASGRNWGQGIGNALQGAAQGMAVDRETAEKAKADALAAAQTNATYEMLAREDPQLAEAVKAGIVSPGEAFMTHYKNKTAPQQDDLTANQRDFLFAQQNPEYAKFLNPPEQPDKPSSVQEYEFAVSQGYKGSMLDFQRELKAAGRPSMNPTTQKELFEAEDAAVAGDYVLSALDEAEKLNETAYDGPFSDVRGDTTALFGDQAGVATSRLKNVTTELALSQLKTIFGAMPTEGERKILLELQGSVNQPKQVRAAIYKRAKEMAMRRIEDNRAKADALRTGDYFQPGYGAGGGGGDDIDAILSGLGI